MILDSNLTNTFNPIMSEQSKFHYSPDIKLKTKPLVEAWLTLHWQLEEIETQTGVFRDSEYPIAIGRFFTSIEDQFAYRIALDADKFPSDVLPHVVRQQFRIGKDTWPVLQLGPGVATLNFTQEYTWQKFRDYALYLRTNLLEASVCVKDLQQLRSKD